LRVKIALFLILLFSILLITPAVISFVDDTQDIAFLLEMNEEEENKGKESAKDLEIKLHQTENFSTFILNEIQKNKNVSFRSKNYTTEYPKITTPPPKFFI
jgi:SUMO ligase MMS21 Smc5/6 complex component